MTSPSGEPLVDIQRMAKRFRSGGNFGRGQEVVAVSDVSLAIGEGEAFGLVGESGSGKTTLGRLLLRLEESTSGIIGFEGIDITHLGGSVLRRIRPPMQMGFQD